MSNAEMSAAPVATDALNVGSTGAEDTGSIESGVETAASAEAAQKAEAKLIRELKLKVHGEEITEELPFEIEEAT